MEPGFATTDVYPFESKEDNKVYPFYDALRKGTLVTTKCKSCGSVKWPPRTICPDCWSADLDWVSLSNEGTIENLAVQQAGSPPGFDSPLVLAIVNVDGVRIFTRIVDAKPEDVHEGAKVRLAPLEVAGGRLIHAFRLSGES